MSRTPAVVRAALAALLALASVALSGCSGEFSSVRLTIASGSTGGVYSKLSTALAGAWSRDPGVPAPEVAATAGSLDNLERLRSGRAQIGFSAADAAQSAEPGAHRLYALARMHDDYLQVVVRDDLPATRVADLRGLRVSLGAVDSGVKLISERLLSVAGISPSSDLDAQYLSLDSSVSAMRAGELDAFFWSGGVPTDLVTDLSASVALRMLDLGDVLPGLRERWPVYFSATLPASAYELPGGPVTTLVVRNFLLVNDQVTDEVATALLRGMFAAQDALVAASPVARSIEVRSAIETTPIPLHPGAVAYYRDVKV
ncbi:TAXI family TRAP transporter solute-binding subunit [Actinosynnema pretiosum]|uniref:TAXI family TRAP transporter solute-binding subunit n=1 Tax=Actinosynnema pretiosum TaxID=42197 RepID=UPI000A92E243|nr:TAXI family TRAP transporter solute-binding subunit [Actinosynnema pretiosum]